MALFSRRCLRRLIDENALFLAPEQSLEHVRRLNIFRDDYLATEWEVVLLNAFSKLGKIQHQPKLGGTRFVDIVFDSLTSSLRFAAEIATISDQPLHKRNPVDRLWEELARQVRKRKITGGGFEFRVGHAPEALKGRGVRHDLLLPPPSRFRELIFNTGFDEFISRVRQFPSRTNEYCVRSSVTDVQIYYNPARTGVWSAGHLAYTCANVVDDNPVFNALKEKARQLKLSNYSGPRGVIICDGGCRMIAPTISTNWAEHSLDQVVAEFFRQHRSVAFAVIVALKHDHSSSIGRGHYHPYVRVGVNPRHADLYSPISTIMYQVVQRLPVIEGSAENALRWARAWPNRAAHFGGYQLSGDKRIRVSAITVLELLSGKLDYATFARAHGFDRRMGNPFALAIREGRTIESCVVEKSPDEDDDWITFEFGEPDPAITRFLPPPSSERDTDRGQSGD